MKLKFGALHFHGPLQRPYTLFFICNFVFILFWMGPPNGMSFRLFIPASISHVFQKIGILVDLRLVFVERGDGGRETEMSREWRLGSNFSK